MTRDKPARSEDFDALYDLPDPRPYYRGLKPSGYAMPERAADAVRALADGRPSFQLLDFACGYGAIGLLLRSRRRMASNPGIRRVPHQARRAGDRCRL